ncbi:hypothetical protein PYCC9005_001199 [Savitreella phatthalungensis]
MVKHSKKQNVVKVKRHRCSLSYGLVAIILLIVLSLGLISVILGVILTSLQLAASLAITTHGVDLQQYVQLQAENGTPARTNLTFDWIGSISSTRILPFAAPLLTPGNISLSLHGEPLLALRFPGLPLDYNGGAASVHISDSEIAQDPVLVSALTEYLSGQPVTIRADIDAALQPIPHFPRIPLRKSAFFKPAVLDLRKTASTLNITIVRCARPVATNATAQLQDTSMPICKAIVIFDNASRVFATIGDIHALLVPEHIAMNATTGTPRTSIAADFVARQARLVPGTNRFVFERVRSQLQPEQQQQHSGDARLMIKQVSTQDGQRVAWLTEILDQLTVGILLPTDTTTRAKVRLGVNSF